MTASELAVCSDLRAGGFFGGWTEKTKEPWLDISASENPVEICPDTSVA